MLSSLLVQPPLVAVYFPEIVANAVLKVVFFMRKAGNGGLSSPWFVTWPWTGYFPLRKPVPLRFIPSSVKLDSAFYHQVSNGSKKGKGSGLTVNLRSTTLESLGAARPLIVLNLLAFLCSTPKSLAGGRC